MDESYNPLSYASLLEGVMQDLAMAECAESRENRKVHILSAALKLKKHSENLERFPPGKLDVPVPENLN